MAMSVAKIKADTHHRLCNPSRRMNKSEKAAAKDERVCPDGKEKSFGAEIRRAIPSSIAKGRGLAISGFRMRLPSNRQRISDRATTAPV